MSEIVLIAVALVLYALASAAEVSLIAVRRSTFRERIEQGDRTAAIVERLAGEPNDVAAVSEFGRAIAGFVAVSSAAVFYAPKLATVLADLPLAWLEPLRAEIAFLVVVIGMAIVVLVFGRFLPRRLAHQYPERIAIALAPVARLYVLVAWPIVLLLVRFANWLAASLGSQKPADASYLFEEEIRTIVDAGQEEGIIEQEEKEMIYSIFEFGDTIAREIMVPRIDVVAVDASTSLVEALDALLLAGHSRIPVYSDTIDNIVGLLYAKDILTYLRDGTTDIALPRILRPAYFVPETKKVNELLEELQQRKVHMAIVVDEYGGTAGIVTIEDILEEIVGEIQDEYDREESVFEVVSPDEVVFNARVNLDEVTDMLGVDLPHEGGDTLGGLIYAELGRVPSPQDEVTVDGLKLTVLSVSGRRIKKVRAMRLPPPQPLDRDGSASIQMGE